MAVKLRLMRMGKKKQPTYRVVAADSRSPRDGRFIEIVGTYDPRQDPSLIKINNDRAVHWLRHGAQPSERVEKLLKISGAWSDFRGDDAAEAESTAGAAKSGKVTVAGSAKAAAAAAVAEKTDDDSVLDDAAADSDADGVANPDDATPFGEFSALPLDDGSAPSDEFTIKGNADSMLYHPPTSPFYGRTVAEVWFTTAEAAQEAGFSLPPSLQNKEDTDDGAEEE